MKKLCDMSVKDLEELIRKGREEATEIRNMSAEELERKVRKEAIEGGYIKNPDKGYFTREEYADINRIRWHYMSAEQKEDALESWK
jgi:DNA polymerase elongation subunit (family B)